MLHNYYDLQSVVWKASGLRYRIVPGNTIMLCSIMIAPPWIMQSSHSGYYNVTFVQKNCCHLSINPHNLCHSVARRNCYFHFIDGKSEAQKSSISWPPLSPQKVNSWGWGPKIWHLLAWLKTVGVSHYSVHLKYLNSKWVFLQPLSRYLLNPINNNRLLNTHHVLGWGYRVNKTDCPCKHGVHWKGKLQATKTIGA